MTAFLFPYRPGLAHAGLRESFKTLFFILWVLLAACAGSALAACPAQPPKLRVTDPASLLGDKADYIAARLGAYQHASGHQLYVLVLPALDGVSIEECAVNVFKDWKLGRKGIDDGVLLLLAVKEHKIRIEVGYGLEGTLTDAKSSRIIHEVMGPLLARGDYAEGVDKGLGAIMDVLGGEASLNAPAERTNRERLGTGPGPVAIALLGFALLLTALLTLPMGIVGLLFIGLVSEVFRGLAFPDGQGLWAVTVVCVAWSVLRWRLIRTNVREYALPRSHNKTLTWIWYFCVFGFAGLERTQQNTSTSVSSFDNDDGGLSYSFSSGDSGASNSGSDSDSSDGGGSGGGGASGDW